MTERRYNLNFLEQLLRKFWSDTKAKVTPKGTITLGIAFFLASIVIPIGIEEIAGANTTGWENPVITIFQTVFPILGVISIALSFLPGE